MQGSLQSLRSENERLQATVNEIEGRRRQLSVENERLEGEKRQLHEENRRLEAEGVRKDQALSTQLLIEVNNEVSFRDSGSYCKSCDLLK